MNIHPWLKKLHHRRTPLALTGLTISALVALALTVDGEHGPHRPMAAAPAPPATVGASNAAPTTSLSVPASSGRRRSAAATPTPTRSGQRHLPVSTPTPLGGGQASTPGSDTTGGTEPIPVSTRPSQAPTHQPVASPTRAQPRPTHTTTQAPPPPAPHVIGDGGLVGSTNSFRSANGAAPLEYSGGLSSDAQTCALQMAKTGVQHCGGNQVVAGAWSIGGCMSGFESDPAHRAILLSPAFTVAGSGVAVDAAGAYYCVINFG
jgi:uncharacterized protein YkwD